MIVDIFNTDKKYNIIYSDPPWSYKRKGVQGCAEKHYNTMSLDDICRLPIKDVAEKDSTLFLWVTMPMLREGLEVIKAWGFEYLTCAFCWVKQNPKNDGIFSGLGWWTRGNAELCLLAKRGKPKRKAKDVKQIVLSHRERHSKKPDEVRGRIVDLLGDLPRIELFAREQFDGWDCWGNEL